jgi:protein-disulfide isomerase
MSQLRPPVGPEDHAEGSASAPVTLVEYGDYECPYCGAAYPIVKRVLRQLGPHVRFVFRNFPLGEMHPHAVLAACAAEAAALQDAFWEMHHSLYEHQAALEPEDVLRYAKDLGLDTSSFARALDDPEIVGRVRADFASGVRSGVNGTPTFFIDGVRFEQSWEDDSLVEALRAAGREKTG